MDEREWLDQPVIDPESEYQGTPSSFAETVMTVAIVGLLAIVAIGWAIREG
ncbi:MAG: hypothetical protein U0798_15260 [Gemmataceae bacterium]